MIPLKGDPSLHMLPGNDSTIGILGAYVDDNLFSRSDDIENSISFTADCFELKPIERDNVEFFGLNRSEESFDGKRNFRANHPAYLSKLRVMPTEATFALFSSVIAAFVWLSHSLPDICCAVSRAAQVTEKTFALSNVKELNEATAYAFDSKDIALVYAPLTRESLNICACADASFSSIIDLTFQLGFIILLCDDSI